MSTMTVSGSSSSTLSGSVATGTEGIPPNNPTGSTGSGDAGGGTGNTSGAKALDFSLAGSAVLGAAIIGLTLVITSILPASISPVFSHNHPHRDRMPEVARPMHLQHTFSTTSPEDLTFEEHQRRREWNRAPLADLFPRITSTALERVLNLAISKPFTYNLSQSKTWNARRLTSIVVAHVRHAYTDYDKLLRDEKAERYEARHRTAPQVWKVLKEWCPWDESNEVLERCFQVTLMRPEERIAVDWDPMDLDADDESEFADDPMDID